MRPLALALSLLLPAAASATPRCNDRIRMATPSARFTVNADGTVTDKATRLIWQRCPVGTVLDDAGTPQVPGDDRCLPAATSTFSWGGALLAAAQFNAAGGLGGATDWRVPNRKELASIVETRCTGPAQNTQIFPEAAEPLFYTSTPNSSAPLLVWATDFGSGGEVPISKTRAVSLRLVRG